MLACWDGVRERNCIRRYERSERRGKSKRKNVNTFREVQILTLKRSLICLQMPVWILLLMEHYEILMPNWRILKNN